MDRTSRVLVILASLVVIIAGLKLGQDVLVPILVGALIVGASSPIVTYMLKRRFPPIAVAGVIIFLDIGILALFAGVLVFAAAELRVVMPRYIASLNNADTWIVHDLANRGITVESPIMSTLKSAKPAGALEGIAAQFAGAASLVTVVLLVTFFTLCEVTTLGDKIRALDKADSHFERIDTIVNHVQRYVVVKVATSAVAGVCVFILLTVCRVDLALMLAIIAFALHFMPNVGPAIAMVPGVAIAAFSRGPGTAAVVTIGYLTINAVVGSVLEPRWLGRSLNLSPLAVLVSLIFWTWMWGPLGAVLSVPLLAIMKIALENVESTKWFAHLLEDAPDQETPPKRRPTHSIIRRPTFVITGTPKRPP